MSASLSESLALAESWTVSFSLTLWNGPASTTGGSFSPTTKTATESVDSFAPSETVSSKVISSSPAVEGATKVGEGLCGSSSSTAGPEVCRQV